MSVANPMIGVALAFALAACSASPTVEEPPMNPPPASSGDDGSCRQEPARRYIGEVATPEVVEEARIASSSRFVRTLRPGQVVTMEYNGDRLNIDVDAANVITNVRCG